MEELETLVIQARKGDVDAYSVLVKRFQDMAYGYSFSLLGDFHLAQDAAQEAFVEAYRNLPQLREPAAFAGWFRRVVFKHCDRFLRGRRPATMPIDEASRIISGQVGPPEIAELNQMKDEILKAIRALPEHERTATSLYYINGYSQKEIADFLEVPEKTVKSRLHSSRKRLKERMIGMVDKTLKGSPLPDDFTEMVARKVASEADLEGARRYLAHSYTGKSAGCKHLCRHRSGQGRERRILWRDGLEHRRDDTDRCASEGDGRGNGGCAGSGLREELSGLFPDGEGAGPHPVRIARLHVRPRILRTRALFLLLCGHPSGGDRAEHLCGA
jgi:RNA polymerase sigma factor (sigma-70 family)